MGGWIDSSIKVQMLRCEEDIMIKVSTLVGEEISTHIEEKICGLTMTIIQAQIANNKNTMKQTIIDMIDEHFKGFQEPGRRVQARCGPQPNDEGEATELDQRGFPEERGEV